MKLPLLTAALLSLPLAAQPEFQPLFDGRTLNAFDVDTAALWSVKDGVITGRHSGLKYNDFLRTKKSYGNFVLKAKFRLKDGAGNSGIQFRSKPVPDSHEVSGFQADIGQQYWGCLYDESRRKRVLAQAPPESLAGLDKSGWNDYVVTAEGARITLELNGKRTVEYVERESGIASTGFIALQVHSGPGIQVEFKDLLIKELPPTPPTLAERYGPAPGDKAPVLAAVDQTGAMRDFRSLSGPKGLFVLFIRSADW
ncbi:MAG: DUF1080 domain-containing protein [Acidobacteria bacterium]|nr:DUF1080 domain-containing protein [Acidobacteriota bacterium]